MQSEEIFKDIAGCEGYQISTKGRVKSLERFVLKSNGKLQHVKESIRKLKTDKDGYKEISLHVEGDRIYKRVHRLVAEAFIPNPENKPQINHLSGQKDQNTVENLNWVSASDNIKHAYKTNLITKYKGVDNHKNKYPEYRIRIIKKLKDILTTVRLGELYNISPKYINHIQSNRRWKHIVI